MPFEMKILICRRPLPPLTKEEITSENALKVVEDIVERLKKEPGWSVKSSSALSFAGDKNHWHEFRLIKEDGV